MNFYLKEKIKPRVKSRKYKSGASEDMKKHAIDGDKSTEGVKSRINIIAGVQIKHSDECTTVKERD